MGRKRIEGNFVLTKAEEAEDGIKILPASGILVEVYICKTTGKLVLFPTKLLKD